MGVADNTPQKGYCIYAHLNLVNDKIYIGISKDVKKRWALKEESYKNCTAIYEAFKKYGWDNFAHIVMWDNMTKEEAIKFEKANIFMYKLAGMSYNITDGGDGTCGIVRSERQKQMMRERMTGRYVSPETRAKLSKTHRELHLTGKKIYAFDIKTKELVKEYPTIGDAASDAGVQPSNISRAARGERPSSGGYIWSFNSTIDRNNPIYNNIKDGEFIKVYCYDLYGNFVREYSTFQAAANAVGGTVQGISLYSNKRNTAYKHFFWRREMCEIEPEVLKKVRFKRHEVN